MKTKVFQIRLTEVMEERLKRNSKSIAKQIREDIALVAALEELIASGMSDRQLGAMMDLAKSILET